MNKAETLELLERNGIVYELSEHRAVLRMADVRKIGLPYPEDEARNLFLRDDKKRSYYLISVRGEQRVSLKALRRTLKTRPLSFASETDLKSCLDLTPGSVTPLGLLNESARRVTLVLQEEFLKGSGRIGVHPNDNTATVWLRAADLVCLIRNLGNEVLLLPSSEFEEEDPKGQQFCEPIQSQPVSE